MDEKKQVKEEPTISEAAEAKSNGEVKVELMDFLVIDELSGNKGADGKAIESKVETKIDEIKENSGESDKKTTAAASKENDSNELNPQDNEKNGDSLILTADEDLEAVAPSPKKIKLDNTVIETDESKQDPKESAVPTSVNTEASDKSKDTAEKSTKNQRVVWVSNISKTIKATDLKQYLSKSGKVITTKIVTDGKRCFGYVLLDNPKDASECIKTLNNTTFEGHKITLSFSKPSKATHSANTSSDPKKPTKSSSHSKRGPDGKHADKTRSTSKHSTEKNKVDADGKTKKESPAKTDKSTDKKASSRSPSRDRYARNLRDDRLKRRIESEERRNREARRRQIELDERQREKEFKLEQERRKLQMEREFFEKQKKEWTRINEERRKLERARIEVEHQRAKLEEDLKKDRLKRKSPDMIPSSIISKLSGPSKMGSKVSKHENYKNLYNFSAPPPPKMAADFDHGRKASDRKLDPRGGVRKIEGIDRKFYEDSTDGKKHYNRKPEFEESKQYMKRYSGDREDEHRKQWTSPIGFGSTIGSAAPRYQNSIPSQVFGSGSSRASGYYYHQPAAATQEFPRYDQLSSRKY